MLFVLNKRAVVSVEKDTLRPRTALGLLVADRIDFVVTVVPFALAFFSEKWAAL